MTRNPSSHFQNNSGRIPGIDLEGCMVALPGQLFYSTQIPSVFGFWRKMKTGGANSASSGLKRRNRKGETLFIDACRIGTLEFKNYAD